MKVESAERRHLPDHGWEHPEGDHDEQVGMAVLEGFEEDGVFEFLWLKQGQLVIQSGALHVGVLDLLATSRRLVGHGHNGNHLITGCQNSFQL